MAGDAANPGGAAPKDDDDLDLDARRGFDEIELAACLRVLRALGTESKDGDGGGGGEKNAAAAGADNDGGGEGGRGGGVSPMFHHKAHKQLRIALQPLLGQLGGQLFHGKDPKAYKAAKQGKRDLNRRQMMERAADRDSLNNTRMRSERLARLAALEAGHDADVLALGNGDAAGVLALGDGGGGDEGGEGGGGGGGVRRRALPLIPDGCAGASASIPFTHHDSSTSARIGNGTGAGDDVDGGRVPREGGGVADEEAAAADEATLLNIPRQCYVCKCRYRRLHHFYASLCPECADVNWRKRRQTADLAGRVAVVTGSRVKIGYRIVLKLLRCGAAVVATTRFPVDARKRYEAEPDAAKWQGCSLPGVRGLFTPGWSLPGYMDHTG
jgi:hypothetical protein